MHTKTMFAISAPIEIEAGEATDGKRPAAKFTSTFYTGGKLHISGYDLPVVVDLAGLENGKVLVANLDHVPTQRVGNFEVVNDGTKLVAHGIASASNKYRDEVVQSAVAGYRWQASLEVMPKKIEEVDSKRIVNINGQSHAGPLYITRSGTLKGFAFVSHGADDETHVSIAASFRQTLLASGPNGWARTKARAMQDLRAGMELDPGQVAEFCEITGESLEEFYSEAGAAGESVEWTEADFQELAEIEAELDARGYGLGPFVGPSFDEVGDDTEWSDE